jgi:hypothetical protein
MPAERGHYRSTFVSLYDDPDFQQLSPLAQALFHNLKARLGQYGIGVFYAGVLPEQFPRVEPATLRTALDELLAPKPAKDHGWFRREGNVLWLVNGLRHEPSISLENRNNRAGVVKFLATLPKAALVNEFAVYYGLAEPTSIEGPPKGVPHPLPRAYPTPGGSTDTDTDTESETDTDTEKKTSVALSRDEPGAPRLELVELSAPTPPAPRYGTLAATADEERVLAHYRAVHPRRRPGETDLRAVRRQLKAKYSVEDLCLAIDGNAQDDWHKERGKHELNYLLRNNGLTDNFIAIATPEPDAWTDIVDPRTGWLTPLGERVTRPRKVS